MCVCVCACVSVCVCVPAVLNLSTSPSHPLSTSLYPPHIVQLTPSIVHMTAETTTSALCAGCCHTPPPTCRRQRLMTCCSPSVPTAHAGLPLLRWLLLLLLHWNGCPGLWKMQWMCGATWTFSHTGTRRCTDISAWFVGKRHRHRQRDRQTEGQNEEVGKDTERGRQRQRWRPTHMHTHTLSLPSFSASRVLVVRWAVWTTGDCAWCAALD